MMGKNKRKTKPSSSGEESFLEESIQHSDKKAKTDTMAEPGASCTNDDLMSRIDSLEKTLRSDFQLAISQAVQKAVETLSHKHDILEGRVHDLEKRKDELQNQNLALRNELEEVKKSVKEQGSAFRDLEQYGRRDNIKVYNLAERRNGNRGETAEETARAVADMIARDLNYRVSPSDISIAHRLGTKEPGKERSVIVRFVSRTVRNEVVRRRRALKGKRVVIADDLSPFFQGVFSSLREIMGKNNVWSSGNQLFVKTTEGVRKVTGANFDNILTQVRENPSLIPTMTISSNDNDSGRPIRTHTGARGGRGRGRGRGLNSPPGRDAREALRGWGRGRDIEETPSNNFMDY